MMEVTCPRCHGSLSWYAKRRRAYCSTCANTVIIYPRRRRHYYGRAVVKPAKPMGKVYERIWVNGELIFEGEVNPQEPVIPIEYVKVKGEAFE